MDLTPLWRRENNILTPLLKGTAAWGGKWRKVMELESLCVLLPSSCKQHRPPSCAITCLLQVQVWLKRAGTEVTF